MEKSLSMGPRPYLRSVELIHEKISHKEEYPFCLPIVKNFERLDFHPDVTFLIGENGSGKSTLIEAIAILMGFNPEGGSKHFGFSTEDSHSHLHQFLRPSKSYKMPKDGFFLRAESFYNAATYIDQVAPLAAYGGVSMHAQSHGESFWSLITNRFRGKGLYILDEPEAALSPTRQMAMLARMHQLVQQESQFIIATHSPILLAYPNAKIYEISDGFLCERLYEETEHYQVTLKFLSTYKKQLNILLADEDAEDEA
jgi:predicted ATPase